jgi:hypothetical protein
MSREEWYGTVNIDNIEEVATRLKELLTGKKFTTVHCYEYRRFEPEVRLHQELTPGTSGEAISLIHHHLKPGGDKDHLHSQIILCDTYGVGGLSTTRIEPGYDHEFNSPYVVFEHDKVTITDRAPNGLLYYAVYAVES